MKKINDYINSLTVEELINTYENEYLPFKKTALCPDGVIKNIAKMFNELSGTYDIKFAERLFLDRCAEIFFEQNKKKEWMEELEQALLEDRKLMAIKIYKDNTGKGLKESKDYIDSKCELNRTKKVENDNVQSELIDAIKMQTEIILRLIGSKSVINLDESIAYCESLVKKYSPQS
jgi:ribosomal protein L7/L12